MSVAGPVDRLELLIAACCDPDLSPSAVKVLSQIVKHYNGVTGQCTPSLERLARTTRQSRRSAIRGVNELCGKGWITRDRGCRDDAAANASNSFSLSVRPRQSDSEVVTGLSLPSDSGDARGSDSRVTRGSDNSGTEVVTGLSPKLSKRTQKGRTRSVSIDSPEFERFWQAYPKRVGKAAAHAVFARIIRDGKATADELIAGAERYAADRAGEDPTFTKHPKTWLNAGSWLDEAAPRRVEQPPRGRQSFSAIDALMRNLNHDE